jgi:hypothetical protein
LTFIKGWPDKDRKLILRELEDCLTYGDVADIILTARAERDEARANFVEATHDRDAAQETVDAVREWASELPRTRADGMAHLDSLLRILKFPNKENADDSFAQKPHIKCP